MLARLDKARQLTASAIKWQPIPDSPQEMAYYNKADELFYGGSAGGGKSDLVLGLAANLHWRSIIFRRVFPSIRALIERSREIFNPHAGQHGKDSYNESLHIWRLESGQMIEFGSIQHEKDVQNYKGRPHDLYAFDELPEFTQYQYRFVTAWLRTTRPNQRTRIVNTGNPPSTAEGEWVIQYWGAWLDPQHPNPAKAGELRWYVTVDGKDTELENGQPFDWKGETLYPKSRSFIPARLTDNPYLRDTGYMATLNGLPEPLRSQLLYGDFGLTTQDDAWQVLPTAWVRMAQDRWQQKTRPDWQFQTALGVDVAHGGQDKTTIASLYGTWFDELVSVAGKDTPLGKDVVRLVRDALKNPKANIGIDAVGYGASAAEGLVDARFQTTKINAGASPDRTSDKTGKFGFANLRAQMYWQLREALDPESGQDVALPPDRELLVDLCAARYTLRSGKYWIEPKEDLKARIGRSPDKGEAVLHAWHAAYGQRKPAQLTNMPRTGGQERDLRHELSFRQRTR